jgi:transposase
MSDREAALLEENTRLKEKQSLLIKEQSHLIEERDHLKEQIEEFERLNGSQQATIKALQERIKGYIRRIYGRKSERIDVTQMVFDDIILAAEKCLNPNEPAPHPDIVEEKVQEHIRRKHPGRKALPPELERIEHYLDIPEKDKKTADGKDRPIIGIDISEKLDYRPAVLVVHRYIRPKYGANDDIEGIGVKQHPPVEGPIDKCLAEPGLLAHVIVEKYEHHTPLYRQELKFERLGIELSRNTMSGWVVKCAGALKPLYERMREVMLSYDIVLNDDTPVKVLDPGSGKTHQGYLWCTVAAEGLKYTMYNFTMSRGREGPSEFFKGYKGYLLKDDYAGYNELISNEEIVEIGCWTHARRYFVEAQDTHPKAANEVLVMIAGLYNIEKRIKNDTADERLKMRQKESRPKLAKILLWLRKNKKTFLPQSPINKAIAHALKIRCTLTRYTNDGRLPIDNNLAENGIRPIALGRKNWLFLGSEDGGETAAILMTFCTTCRKLKINTWAYLTDVLRRINTHPMSRIDDLLPDHWQQLRQAKA